MVGFAASVDAWAKASQQRMRAVFRESAQRLANEVRVPVAAGGNMPVKTGNLRRSLRGSTAAMPRLGEQGAKYEDGSAQVTLAIAGAELGQTIYLGFQANYAPYMENRYQFVGLAAQRWQDIVRESVTELKRRTGG
jgi:hypothetical protein